MCIIFCTFYQQTVDRDQFWTWQDLLNVERILGLDMERQSLEEASVGLWNQCSCGRGLPLSLLMIHMWTWQIGGTRCIFLQWLLTGVFLLVLSRDWWMFGPGFSWSWGFPFFSVFEGILIKKWGRLFRGQLNRWYLIHEAECSLLPLNVIIITFILLSLNLSSFLFNEVLCFLSSQILFLLNTLSFSMSI